MPFARRKKKWKTVEDMNRDRKREREREVRRDEAEPEKKGGGTSREVQAEEEV